MCQAEVTPMKRLRVVSCSRSIYKLSIFPRWDSLHCSIWVFWYMVTALLENFNNFMPKGPKMLQRSIMLQNLTCILAQQAFSVCRSHSRSPVFLEFCLTIGKHVRKCIIETVSSDVLVDMAMLMLKYYKHINASSDVSMLDSRVARDHLRWSLFPKVLKWQKNSYAEGPVVYLLIGKGYHDSLVSCRIFNYKYFQRSTQSFQPWRTTILTKG